VTSGSLRQASAQEDERWGVVGVENLLESSGSGKRDLAMNNETTGKSPCRCRRW